jgi:hypothetical protein
LAFGSVFWDTFVLDQIPLSDPASKLPSLELIKYTLGRAARPHKLGEVAVFISFRADHPGARYSGFKPAANGEIKIVLQQAYSDLTISESGFSVVLPFKQEPHSLTVPFEAITAFRDAILEDENEIDREMPPELRGQAH